MKKKIFRYFLALLSVGAMSSCTKVIDIELDEAQDKIAIVGNVTNGPGPYQVQITPIVPYLSSEPAQGINDAVVVISDDQGVTDTLESTSNGFYQTGHLRGAPGHTYFLTVTYKGKEYKASSYLPSVSNFDSMSIMYRNKPPFYAPGYYATVYAPEPLGVGNFYRLKVSRNDTLFNTGRDIMVANDEPVDGNQIQLPIRYTYQKGDKITCQLFGITKQEYEYWTAVLQQVNSTGMFDPPLANPPTNITNGAMGYFSAHSEVTISKIVQ